MKIGIAYDTPEMYDFAFSFAGEDRKIVESVKNYLVKNNYTVFYDNDFQHVLVGKDLYAYLREIYKDKCKFVVCFISENYTKKVWTNLEFTAVKERLMSTFFASDFLIPVQIDSTGILKDIPSYIGFYQHKNAYETSQLLINKFKNSIVEDNYLFNMSNCIKYICKKVGDKLSQYNYNVEQTGNSISINIYNTVFEYKFIPEDNLNIQSILVFCGNNRHPDLFISWSRKDILRFDIHYFSKIKPVSENVEINSLTETIVNYIINNSEML